MSGSKIVNDLYKFLQGEVTLENLQESTNKAFEGKLPNDLSQVKDPDKEVQLLAEEKDEGDVKPVEQTDKNKETKIEKEMHKQTPDVDKKSDAEQQKGENKVKDEKKKEPKVSGVNKVKESEESEDDENAEAIKAANKSEQDRINKEATKEGKLPDDPSKIDNVDGDIQKLSEERLLTTVSDEEVAKDISRKYPGSRIVTDTEGPEKKYMIMVKEEVQEDVTATINTDDKDITVSTSDDGTTTVTTTDNDATPAEVDSEEETPLEIIDEPQEEPSEELNAEDLQPEDSEVFSESKIEELAEKIFLADYLKIKKELSEREEQFIKEIDELKIPENIKEKIDEKIKGIKEETK